MTSEPYEDPHEQKRISHRDRGSLLGAGRGHLAFAGKASVPALRTGLPSRKARTTKLFKSPPGHPNGIAVAPEGLWIGDQKLSGAQAAAYHLPEPKDLSESAWLVDWNGKLLKTVTTPLQEYERDGSRRRHCVWMGANAAPEGISFSG